MLPEREIPDDVRRVIAMNLRAILARSFRNPSHMAAHLNMQPKSVIRLLDGGQDFGVLLVEAVAQKLGCKAWQLLVPNLDVNALPRPPETPSDAQAKRDALHTKILMKMDEVLTLIAENRDPELHKSTPTGVPDKPTGKMLPPGKNHGGSIGKKDHPSQDRGKRGGTKGLG